LLLDQDKVFDVPQGYSPYNPAWEGDIPEIWSEEFLEGIDIEEIKKETKNLNSISNETSEQSSDDTDHESKDPPSNSSKRRTVVKWKKPEIKSNRKIKIPKEKHLISYINKDSDDDFTIRGRKWGYKHQRSREYTRLTGDQTEWKITNNIHDFCGLDFTTHSYYMSKTGVSSKYKIFKYNPTARVKIEHFLGKANVALPRFPTTEFLHIHIDQADQKVPIDDVVTILVDSIGKPVWIEYFKHSDSYLLIYKLDMVLTKSRSFQKFEEILTFGDEIKPRVIYGSRVSPLPLSRLATKTGTFSFYEDNFIKEEVGIHNMTRIINSGHTIPVPRSVKVEEWRAIKVPNVEKTTELDITRFSYGRGTRYTTQYKIAHYCIHKKISVDAFIMLCKQCNDGSSKDMASWSEERMNNVLTNTYNYAAIHHVDRYSSSGEVKTKDGLIYNPNYKTLNENEEADLKIILHHTYKKEKLGSIKDGKTENRIVTDAMKIYSFFIQRRDYEKRVDRLYTSSKFEFLNKGTMFSESMIQLFAKEKGIKNWKKCWKLIELSGLVEAISTEVTSINGKKLVINHSYFLNYRWCKHYISNSIKKIMKLIVKSVKFTHISYISSINYNINNLLLLSKYRFNSCINNTAKFFGCYFKYMGLSTDYLDPGGG